MKSGADSGVNSCYIALSPFSDLAKLDWLAVAKEMLPQYLTKDVVPFLEEAKTPRASASPAKLSNTTFWEGGSNSHISSSSQF